MNPETQRVWDISVAVVIWSPRYAQDCQCTAVSVLPPTSRRKTAGKEVMLDNREFLHGNRGPG
jgi:hypothetical protein